MSESSIQKEAQRKLDELNNIRSNTRLSQPEELEVHQLEYELNLYLQKLIDLECLTILDVEDFEQREKYRQELTVCMAKADRLLKRLQKKRQLEKPKPVKTQEIDASLQMSEHPNQMSRHQTPEANTSDSQMIPTASWKLLLEKVKAIGQISTPQIIRGRATGENSTGTGWLIASGLALTCYHVIKARGEYDTSDISLYDLNIQVTNTVLMFDYLLPGQGIEYRIVKLECYDANLDYALLRVEDRPNNHLAHRSFLKLGMHTPLTLQTNFYIIQHPNGQPQYNSVGRFLNRQDGKPHQILHNALTDHGTSGAPVLNAKNWEAIALHIGEDREKQFRIATLLEPILDHIKETHKDLHDYIENQQFKLTL